MFWTNWNDRQASIQRAYLSGWNVTSVIQTDIKTPNGLAIDHRAQKLYWSDANLDKIERCEFDGSGRTVSRRIKPCHISTNFSLVIAVAVVVCVDYQSVSASARLWSGRVW